MGGGYSCTCKNLKTKVKTNNKDKSNRGKEYFAPGVDLEDSDGGGATFSMMFGSLCGFSVRQATKGFNYENTNLFLCWCLLENSNNTDREK